MGKLKIIGIGIGSIIGIIIVIAIVSSVSEAMQYSGLTDKQIQTVKIIKETCESNAGLAGLTSQTVGDMYQKQCDEVVAQKIAEYRTINQNGGKSSSGSNSNVNQATSQSPSNTPVNSNGVSDTIKYGPPGKEAFQQPINTCNQECTINIALQNHNSTICTTLDNSDPCMVEYVNKFNEPEKCNQATHTMDCFKQVSMTMGPSVCNLMNNNNYAIMDCVSNFFNISNKGVTGAYSQSNKAEFQKCLGQFGDFPKQNACVWSFEPLQGVTSADLLGWKAGNDLVACSSLIPDSIAQQKNDYCIASIGVYEKSLSICDQAGIARAECYGGLADTDSSITLDTCNRLDTGVTFCYMHVAYRLKDLSICDKTGDNKDNCLRMVRST